MTSSPTADRIDRQILRALVRHPNASHQALSVHTDLARNTVRSRLNRYEEHGLVHGFERRIDPAYLGYPFRACISATVVQRALDLVAEQLALIPEVLEVLGVAGASDLVLNVVARDADDLYRVAGLILSTEGITRTETGIVMRTLVPYRAAQLIDQA